LQFYRFDRGAELVQVYRILDLRRDPLWIRERLQSLGVAKEDEIPSQRDAAPELGGKLLEDDSARVFPMGRRLPRSGRRNSRSAEARGRIHLSIVLENVALINHLQLYPKAQTGTCPGGRNALEMRDPLPVAGSSWATFWATNIL
jgi:hypothetical protein